MRRLFVTIFLWFWLTLLGVALVLVSFIAHAGLGYRALVRLSIHDLLLFTLAGGIFCYFISRYLTKPLNKLGEAAANIAEGRFDRMVAWQNRQVVDVPLGDVAAICVAKASISFGGPGMRNSTSVMRLGRAASCWTAQSTKVPLGSTFRLKA